MRCMEQTSYHTPKRKKAFTCSSKSKLCNVTVGYANTPSKKASIQIKFLPTAPILRCAICITPQQINRLAHPVNTANIQFAPIRHSCSHNVRSIACAGGADCPLSAWQSTPRHAIQAFLIQSFKHSRKEALHAAASDASCSCRRRA